MIDFKGRLTKLKNRRQGTADQYRLEKALNAWYDARPHEDYEQINESSAIKYVVGSMAAVSQESTQISIKEGERVASTLIGSLQTAGIPAEMKLQGSVALNIHIEGHSDVDMLILKSSTVSVESPIVNLSEYTFNPYGRLMIDVLKEFREKSEQNLSSRYHAATVNTSKGKCISLSGGSLQRKVDIVPSTWHDTVDYQRTHLEHLRAVNIYDKKEHKLHENKPFLHIRRINDRDSLYRGNLKKVIRLMKNIVADMPDDKRAKVQKLTSYDIAGIAYAMDKKLDSNIYYPLSLLDNLRTYLMILVFLEERRSELWVPDETRKVFDSVEKLESLRILYSEVSDLALAVQKSLNPATTEYNGSYLANRLLVI